MPKSAAKTPYTVEELLEGYPPEIRELVERLRVIIRETVPEAAETANPVWRSISFNHPQGGYFCGIFPELGRVNLAFEFGVLLPDSEGLLVGTGKQVRYLRLQPLDEIPLEALRVLLIAAISLPSEREAKQQLIRASARQVKGE